MAKNSETQLEKLLQGRVERPACGMTVPEGYFADFARQMIDKLPERAEVEHPDAITDKRLSLWAKIRPYVYMAAMFAGVWLMLQMFTMISGQGKLRPMDSNPILAEALSNDTFVYDYIVDDVDQWTLVDEMIDDGTLAPEGGIELFDAFPIEVYEDDASQILPE